MLAWAYFNANPIETVLQSPGCIPGSPIPEVPTTESHKTDRGSSETERTEQFKEAQGI